MFWLGLVVGCANDVAVAPAPVAPAPAPKVVQDPTPAAPAAPEGRVGPPDHGVSIAAVVLSVSERLIRAATPEGELELPVRKGAWKGSQPEVGRLVKLDVGLGPCGEFLVVGKTDHQGLPIQFGRVVEKTTTQMTIQAPTGLLTYKVHPVSDITKGVDVGAWVSVKSFQLDEEPHILNTRAHPGKVQDVGVLTKVGAGTFTVRSLSGERCWKGEPAGLEEGDGVIVEGTWHNGRGFTPTIVRAQTFPARFVGKLQARQVDKVVAVDAWGAYLGRVEFTLGGPCDSACQDITPGDLMDVDWHLDGTEPVIDTMHERPLSPVYFGKIDVVGKDLLTLTTLQNRTKYLKLAPETVMAQLVEPGDYADVVYKEDPSGGNPTAVLVAKR